MGKGIISYRDKDGNVKDIPALRGRPGYTPVKGKDYFTPEEVDAIVTEAVDEALSVMKAPTLLPEDSWYVGKTTVDKSVITEIHIVDQYTPTDPDAKSWNADTEDSGGITCHLEGTVVTIAGNGSGRIMANPCATRMFGSFTSVTVIAGLDLIDTRNVLILRNALSNLPKMQSIKGFENWDVRKCESFYMFIAQPTTNAFKGALDFSRWNVSRAVQVALEDANKTDEDKVQPFRGMINKCCGAASVSFNRTFDLSVDLLYLPENLEGEVWMDTATGQTYYDIDGNEMVDDRDGLPNPAFEGRNITFEAVRKESEVTI